MNISAIQSLIFQNQAHGSILILHAPLENRVTQPEAEKTVG